MGEILPGCATTPATHSCGPVRQADRRSGVRLLWALAPILGGALLGCGPTSSGSAGRSRGPAPVPVREELNVVYGTGGGVPLELDLYAPKLLPAPAPAVVVLHGGGWGVGCKEECRSWCRTFAERGYVAVTIAYRLAPHYRFPAQVEDAKCAVRWLRAGAAHYRVDPERVGAVGISASGYLALLLALTDPKNGFEGKGGYPEQSSHVQAAINLMGPTDLTRLGWPAITEGLIASLLGGRREQLPEVYRTASPVTYAHGGAPPVLTIHGTADWLVPYEQATVLDAALHREGVATQLETLEGRSHGEDWTAAEWNRTTRLSLEFLDRYLKR